ncbi:MAG TPA: serine hydrolase [Solirubrobacterales bacterium]|nr:serine hydrolase [Solirubrobacterales bacterium]
MRRWGAVALVGLLLAGLTAPTLAAPAAGVSTRVEGAVARSARGTNWKPRMRAAKRYAKRRAGKVNFAVVDLRGRLHAYRGAHTAPTASVIKVMFLVAYLRQHSVRHRDLRHSDRRLLGPMIKRSDNVAATRVRDIVGARAVNRVARVARMRDFHFDRQVWGLSRTSARDQARFMYRLHHYIPKRHRRYARHLLHSIVPSQRWGIAKVRPRGWKLYFKGGWGTGTGRVDHQVAFLQNHSGRVSVAILTEFDPSHGYGKHTLKGVAARLIRGLPRRLPH